MPSRLRRRRSASAPQPSGHEADDRQQTAEARPANLKNLGSIGFVLAHVLSGKNILKQLSLWFLLMNSRWVRLAKTYFFDQFLSETSTADREGISSRNNFFAWISLD
jgi:hypothetical protein